MRRLHFSALVVMLLMTWSITAQDTPQPARGRGGAQLDEAAARYASADVRILTVGIIYNAGLVDLATAFTKETGKKVAVNTMIMGSAVNAIKTANPDIFLNIATPKFAAQAIKKLAELNWHPVHIVTNISVSVGAVLKPAGLDNSKDILSAGFQIDVTDPQWDGYQGMHRFRAFMAKYYPQADRSESGPMIAFNSSTVLVEVLRQCGDNLTRDNVMKVAANLDLEVDTLIPGVRIKTTPTDFYPIEQLQMMRFTGERWQLFGPILDGHDHRVAP